MDVKEIKFDENGYAILDVDGVFIQVKEGVTEEELKEEIKKRKKRTSPMSDDFRTSRDINMRQNLFNRLKKAKNEEDILKIVNTSIKFSEDDMFEYKRFSDLLKEKGYKPIKKPKDITNTDELTKFIIGQVIYSIDNYSAIHPKIKLVISDINKMRKAESEEKTTEEEE